MSMSLNNPGDLIAAIPALLGFVPERSVVFVLVKPETGTGTPLIALVVRTDLPAVEDKQSFAEITTEISQLCTTTSASGVAAVFIDDQPPIGPNTTGDGDRDHRGFLTHLRSRLGERGIQVSGLQVGSLTAGARWRSVVDADAGGIVPDPAASPIAAHQVLHGRPVRMRPFDREEVLAVDTPLREQVCAAMPEAASDAARRIARAAQIGDREAYSRMALWRVLQTIKHLAASGMPTPQLLAEAGIALGDTEVRDCMFAVALGEHAAAAEQLWTLMTRTLPDPQRAEAAALVAFSAYLRGDGVLAATAVTVALQSDPNHRMAQLIATALRFAVPPERLTRVGHAAIEIATRLRIDIGVDESSVHHAQAQG